MNFLSIAALITGGWIFFGGILHDICVLRSDYGKQYDRNLLRLLLDGHILISHGIIQFIAIGGLLKEEKWAFYISGFACISILIYMALTFPFLKSFVTIFLNLALLILLIVNYF